MFWLGFKLRFSTLFLYYEQQTHKQQKVFYPTNHKVQYAGSEMKHIFTRNVHDNNNQADSELKQFFIYILGGTYARTYMKRMLTGVGQGEQNVVSSEKMLRLLLYTGQLLDQQQHVHIGAYIFTASISLRLTAPSSSIPLALIELSPKSIPFYKCFKCSGQALSYDLARYFLYYYQQRHKQQKVFYANSQISQICMARDEI